MTPAGADRPAPDLEPQLLGHPPRPDVLGTDQRDEERRPNLGEGPVAAGGTGLGGEPPPLPVTAELSRSTLGVPMFRDLNPADVDRVIERIEAS